MKEAPRGTPGQLSLDASGQEDLPRSVQRKRGHHPLQCAHELLRLLLLRTEPKKTCISPSAVSH